MPGPRSSRVLFPGFLLGARLIDELVDDSVEAHARVGVLAALFSGTHGAEVLGGAGGLGGIKRKDNAASRLYNTTEKEWGGEGGGGGEGVAMEFRREERKPGWATGR
eukprot:scaffold19691_cov61-Isochrysis_galbana.AAC.1